MKLSFYDTAPAGAAGARGSICEPLATKVEAWDAGARRFVCEPLFVPKPHQAGAAAAGGAAAGEEDEGWVLAILHNAEVDRGELVILDAQDIAAGPLATIRLPHHLPAGLHGSFCNQVLLQNWEELREGAWRHPENTVRAI